MIPEPMKALAGKLGLTDKQLEALRKERGSDEAVMKWMKHTYEQLRDKPRLLGKTGGYTERPGFALRITHVTETGREGEPEAVDDLSQKRITREAKEREREAAGQLIVAAEELRAALKDRIEDSPEFMKMAGRDVWLIRSKLDRLVRNARRRAA